MIHIYNHQTNTLLGTIDDDQLDFLREHLVKESLDDTDYYIMSPTVDLMESAGASPALITLLRGAIGSNDSVEIRYEQTTE